MEPLIGNKVNKSALAVPQPISALSILMQIAEKVTPLKGLRHS